MVQWGALFKARVSAPVLQGGKNGKLLTYFVKLTIKDKSLWAL